MANYARITLIGTVGQEPQQKQAGNFTVVETSLAVNNKRGDVETTNWYRLTFWNKQGEVAMQYVRKGEQLFVEGRLQVRDYTKADGTAGYALEVTVSDLQLMGSRNAAGEGGQAGGYRASEPAAGSAPAQAPQPIRPAGTAAVADDDLPF
jgi:single-strand DNA-binding protein